ncbi:MAG: hypothetical protein A3G81_08250 [Betaproteobacteria bacterium RIFCSPLOWO2_12_FULL_65_14]|nr:MAG: hypothetical protein A3G81_08250 [Betaproteobacteria bacterium RIFCSPLOWO2_12_FULL_65_14]
MYWGSLLHDIGKIGIPDAILLKNGALGEDEWARMRGHAEAGHRILARVPGLKEAAEIGRMRGSQFDARAVDAFFAETTTLRRMVALKCTVPEAFTGGNGEPIRTRQEGR